jgi:hypothetical protein
LGDAGAVSTLATALPIAVGDMSRSRAAARKLRSLAMATTASRSINPLSFIVTTLWIRQSRFISIIATIKAAMVQMCEMTQGVWNG